MGLGANIKDAAFVGDHARQMMAARDRAPCDGSTRRLASLHGRGRIR
jgi:hypothetical protein